MYGIRVDIDFTKLDEYPGLLADALIPCVDKITGEPYKITAANVLVGGTPVMFKHTAAGGSVETIVALHGKVVTIVFRGLGLAGYTTTTGTPSAQEVKWDNSSDELTSPSGNDWLPGETLYIQYIN